MIYLFAARWHFLRVFRTLYLVMIFLVLAPVIESADTSKKVVSAEKPPSNRARMADGGVGHIV
jgi:predicted double-glycine peptidase